MNKKDLKKIITEFQTKKNFNDETRFYIEEKIKEDVTCWGIYKQIEGNQYRLLLIHFFDKETWISYVNNKWLNGKLESLKDFQYESLQRCQSSMQKKYNELVIWEYKRGQEKKQEYYDKKLAEFKEANKNVPKDLPINFKRFIIKQVMPGYALYNNKEHKAQCTTCNKEFEINKLKRKDIITCPSCRKKITCLPSGKFRIYDSKYACLVQKIEKEKLVLRYFLATHKKDKNNDLKWSFEVRRDFINLDTGDIDSYIWETFKGSYKTTFIPEKYYKNTYSFYTEKDYWIGEASLWTGNLYNIEKLKYVFRNIPIQNKKYISKNITRTIGMIIKYPFLESWIKLGKNINIIAASLETIKPHITEPSKAIGIPRNIIRNIPNYSDKTIISNIKYLMEKNINISREVIKYLADNKVPIKTDIETWKNNNNFNLKRLITYIAQNKINFLDYRDYYNKLIQVCNKLNNSVLYPKNFNESHDEILLQEKYKREQIKEELYEKIKEKSKYKKLKIGNLTIRQPDSVREIVLEGLRQSNCVKTYIDRIINQETTVLFGRKSTSPDEPYITIEIKNDKVIQARYSHNINCEPEIYQKISDYIDIINRKRKSAA